MEVVLDEAAIGAPVTVFAPCPDFRLAAYVVARSSELTSTNPAVASQPGAPSPSLATAHTLHIVDAATGADIVTPLADVGSQVAWSSCGRHLYYISSDESSLYGLNVAALPSSWPTGATPACGDEASQPACALQDVRLLLFRDPDYLQLRLRRLDQQLLCHALSSNQRACDTLYLAYRTSQAGQAKRPAGPMLIEMAAPNTALPNIATAAAVSPRSSAGSCTAVAHDAPSGGSCDVVQHAVSQKLPAPNNQSTALPQQDLGTSDEHVSRPQQWRRLLPRAAGSQHAVLAVFRSPPSSPLTPSSWDGVRLPPPPHHLLVWSWGLHVPNGEVLLVPTGADAAASVQADQGGVATAPPVSQLYCDGAATAATAMQADQGGAANATCAERSAVPYDSWPDAPPSTLQQANEILTTGGASLSSSSSSSSSGGGDGDYSSSGGSGPEHDGSLAKPADTMQQRGEVLTARQVIEWQPPSPEVLLRDSPPALTLLPHSEHLRLIDVVVHGDRLLVLALVLPQGTSTSTPGTHTPAAAASVPGLSLSAAMAPLTGAAALSSRLVDGGQSPGDAAQGSTGAAQSQSHQHMQLPRYSFQLFHLSKVDRHFVPPAAPSPASCVRNDGESVPPAASSASASAPASDSGAVRVSISRTSDDDEPSVTTHALGGSGDVPPGVCRLTLLAAREVQLPLPSPHLRPLRWDGGCSVTLRWSSLACPTQCVSVDLRHSSDHAHQGATASAAAAGTSLLLTSNGCGAATATTAALKGVPEPLPWSAEDSSSSCRSDGMDDGSKSWRAGSSSAVDGTCAQRSSSSSSSDLTGAQAAPHMLLGQIGDYVHGRFMATSADGATLVPVSFVYNRTVCNLQQQVSALSQHSKAVYSETAMSSVCEGEQYLSGSHSVAELQAPAAHLSKVQGGPPPSPFSDAGSFDAQTALLGAQAAVRGAPCVLSAYGAYGAADKVAFSPQRLALLDEGVVVAVAHVRGGAGAACEQGGCAWHHYGHGPHKAAGALDFVGAAQALLSAGIAAPGRLAVECTSAGGWVVGAALNVAPELFRAAVMTVPSLDVLTTAVEEQYGHYELGHALTDAQAYADIKSWSPLDNIRACVGGTAGSPRRQYPHVLVRTALDDTRVEFWDPVKYSLELRHAVQQGCNSCVDPNDADSPTHGQLDGCDECDDAGRSARDQGGSGARSVVLLHVKAKGGHSAFETPRDEATKLAFLLRSLAVG